MIIYYELSLFGYQTLYLKNGTCYAHKLPEAFALNVPGTFNDTAFKRPSVFDKDYIQMCVYVGEGERERKRATSSARNVQY